MKSGRVEAKADGEVEGGSRRERERRLRGMVSFSLDYGSQ